MTCPPGNGIISPNYESQKRVSSMTKEWQIKPEDANIDHPVIREAAELLRAGEQVAFPTETVYGL